MRAVTRASLHLPAWHPPHTISIWPLTSPDSESMNLKLKVTQLAQRTVGLADPKICALDSVSPRLSRTQLTLRLGTVMAHLGMWTAIGFFFLIFYLRERERERENPCTHVSVERDREGERERERESQLGSTLRAECWGLIPQPWDHDLSQYQELDAQRTEPPRRPKSSWILSQVDKHWGHSHQCLGTPSPRDPNAGREEGRGEEGAKGKLRTKPRTLFLPPVGYV